VAEALFILLFEAFCLFVGRLIRRVFLGQLGSLVLRHDSMIAHLRVQRRIESAL
jgi:hypothetical protein